MTTPRKGSGIFGSARPAQSRFLAPRSGLPREIADVREDVAKAFSPLANIVVEEFTNPEATATNAIKTSIAASTSAASYSGAALNGAVGGAEMAYARAITVSTSGSTPADVPATATITGEDVDGNALTETINLSQTVATVTGTKLFKKVTLIEMPAGQGTDAALVFGISSKIGLTETPITRASLAAIIREIAAGSLVTTGTITTTDAPYGSYTPASAPNGTNDYAIYYEAVPET